MTKKYDLFISHASEDKDSVVRRLAETLERAGLEVWYDDFSLRLGDSLSASIDKGIRDSRYGLLVLSPHFLNKNWPDYEYRSLLSRQVDGEKVILPLWYGVSREDVKNYSPYLADIKSLTVDDTDLRPVVMEVMRVVRPDIFREMKMAARLKELIDKAKPVRMAVSDIVPATKKRSTLTPQQIIRAKAIYFGIGQHLHLTLQQHIDEYELDVMPERELQTWEIMNVCYAEMLHSHPEATEADKFNYYKVLLGLSVGNYAQGLDMPEDELKELYMLWVKNFYKF